MTDKDGLKILFAVCLKTLTRYRKALEHIAEGKERGGMCVAIAKQALAGTGDYDGEGLVKLLKKKVK